MSQEFYQVEDLLVQARGQEINSIKDFIRPDDVVHLYLTHSSTYDAWSLVKTEIKHYVDSSDYWQFPLETWHKKTGDCEDRSLLLASILRNWSENVYAVGGEFKGEGHAWVVVNDQIIDPSSRNYYVDSDEYKPFIYWNDREIFVREGYENKLVVTKFRHEFRGVYIGHIISPEPI